MLKLSSHGGDMREFTWVKIFLLVAIIITSATDLWLVLSGNVNFRNHWPGILQIGCICWLVIIHKLDMILRNEARRIQTSPPSRK